MSNVFSELNNDQLDGLAKLCFDLAKGAFLIALFPTLSIQHEPLVIVLNIIVGLIVGVAFTYTALLLLKWKKE